MVIILSLVSFGLLALLLIVAAIETPHAPLSLYELRRRRDEKDGAAADTLRREQLRLQWRGVQKVLEGMLLVAVALLLVFLLGWGRGVPAAVLLGLLYLRLARLSFIKALAGRLYAKAEGRLLAFIEKHASITMLLTGKVTLREKRLTLGSHEELLHVLEGSRIFSDDDRRLIKSILHFKKQTVEDVMTSKDAIVSVKHTELLGPLVLDDLHKTGHTIFPVMRGDDIVGLLDSSDHVALRNKESVKASSVMQVDVHTINQGAVLDEALKVFLETKQQLLIVIDDGNQPVGLVSLGDILRALAGRSLS